MFMYGKSYISLLCYNQNGLYLQYFYLIKWNWHFSLCTTIKKKTTCSKIYLNDVKLMILYVTVTKKTNLFDTKLYLFIFLS